MELANKTVLLTGATGGIGRAIAKKIHTAGAKLILTGRDQDVLQNLNRNLGNRHVIFKADLTSAHERKRLSQLCWHHSVDILINNAGTSDCDQLEAFSAEAVEKTIAINLTVPLLLTQCLLPLLKSRPESAIVNIGSTFGSIGFPGFGAYCASKFGLRGFSQSLRRELADTSVKVLYLAPRATLTAINSDSVVAMNNALGNAIDKPDRVATAALKLIEREQNEFYLGWPEKLFVRINALLPSLVDKTILKQLPTIRRFYSTSAKQSVLTVATLNTESSHG